MAFIRDNYDQMSKAAAKIIAKQVKKTDSVLGLATGFTPIVYRELVRMHKEEGLNKDVSVYSYEYLAKVLILLNLMD